MAHLDWLFPTGISYGAVVIINTSTDVVSFPSGGEQRNSTRALILNSWDVAKGCKSEADRTELITGFRVARGKLHTFSFEDPADNTATVEEGAGEFVSTGVYQMRKLYQNSGGADYRTIRIPKPGTVTVYINDVLQTEGGGAGNYSIDGTSGLIVFVPSVTKAITAITQANPGKVTTSAAHGLLTGQEVLLSGIAGMTQLNGQTVAITVVDADEFTIGVNTTAYTAYTSGGQARMYPQAGDVITWAGGYYVKARFDTNELRMINSNLEYFIAQNIPVIEEGDPEE